MSLVLSADGQNLDSGNSTTLWTGAQSFTIAAWFKKASDQNGSLFGVFRSDNPTYSVACLRFSSGGFDHGLKLAGEDLRLDDSGALTSGWDLAVITVNDGVELKSYFNGALKKTTATAGSHWGGPADRIIVGNHTFHSWNTGRGKIAHAALWDTVLSAAQVADLWNGGAGGAGKNPLAVASWNLRTYLPLISNATDETGTFTLTATGAPTYDGADNPNVEASGPADTTAPTLSAASVSSVAATTATGNVTTNEGNGTLYSVVSTSATAPSAAQIQSGNDHTGSAAVWSGNQAVSSSGAKTLSITGLTSSTSYYAHFQHKDSANNNSTVVTSAQFTTGLADTTNPTMTGSVTISAKTTTSYTATWPSGSDNVAVTGYEYRLNAGSWVDLGSVLTVNISARTPGSTDTFEVRAYDAAGNKATALSINVTLLIGTITITDVTQWETNVARPSNAGITVDISNISTGALVVRKTGQVTTAGSDMEIKDALIADATTYQVVTRFADGSVGVGDFVASLT